MASIGIIVYVLFFAVIGGIITGIVMLQVFLSKRESIWPGLIMPLLSFGFSLLVLFGMVAYSTISTAEVHDTTVVGTRTSVVPDDTYYSEEWRQERAAAVAEREAEMAAILAEIEAERAVHLQAQQSHVPRTIFMFILINIPTAILLLIYAGCRGSRRNQRALDLMNLQDL